jgi:hypothetical protein
MKIFAILVFVFISACAQLVSGRQAQLDAEEDFHSSEIYLEDIYAKYDSEYADDCFYYEDLVCEFEQ